MKMEIDFFEILRLIDACFGGSTGVTTGFIVKVTNRYDSFSEEERVQIFKNIYGIKRLARNTYSEKMLARFDPDNQYIVEKKSEGPLRAFKFKDAFYVNNDWRIFNDEILKVEKI